jgi:hypothetical protein
VRAFGVVVGAPCGERDAGMVQRWEQGLVQQPIAQATLEAFDKGTLEPRRVCRRLIDVSYAAITSVSRAA